LVGEANRLIEVVKQIIDHEGRLAMGRDLDVEITGVSVVGSGSESWGDLSWSVIEWISCSQESIRYVFIFSYFSILFYFSNILACCNQYFCDIFTIILFGCSIFTIFCYTIFHFSRN
jgi:hypothetical protein